MNPRKKANAGVRRLRYCLLTCARNQLDAIGIMLNLVVTLLIIALIAAVLGFGGIASAAVGIAKIVFLVALLLFVIAAVVGTIRTV